MTMTTRTRNSWRRAAAAFLALVLVASACEAAPQPKDTSDVGNASELALDAAYLLLRLSAYDYALAGTLTGAKTHVVSFPRYSSVVRESAANIQRFTGNALGATLDASGPLRDRVVTLADTLVDVSRSSTRYADGGDPAAFAEVIGGVRQAWKDLDSLARMVRPANPDLAATIERGSSFLVAATPGKVYALRVGPFASAAEANDAARRVGTVESVSTEAPFIVRTGTYADRAAAEAEATKLSVKGFTGVISEEDLYRFGRSGPAPDAELWLEPERVIDTYGGGRRIAVAPDAHWIVTGHDDGTVAVFSSDGVLRQLPRLHAGIALLALNDDGYWAMGGGITLRNFMLPSTPGGPHGEAVFMPSPTSEIVYVPGANYFAAVAKGNGGGGVIAGRTPDGVRLLDPFPIRVPETGAAIAASGWGHLYYAWTEGGTTQIDVVIERNVLGVLRLPGNVLDLVVNRQGSHGAVMTDQGVYRFGPLSMDPAGSLKRVGDPVRQIGIGADGTLYLMTQTKLTAQPPDAKEWSAPLVDGRRLLVAARPLVLDGADRVLTFSGSGIAETFGTSGTILDISVSPNGKHIAVLADGSRAQIFKLP